MDPALALEVAALSHQKTIDEATARGDSDIQQFYYGATVFLTGGSGFLGKQLIEKLFRSCNIKKLYMLVRVKKEKPIQERLEETLKDPVFDAVKKLKPDFANSIALVEGNIADTRLGISDLDWRLMSEEVNVIFHVAATTRFDENLRDATFMNVRGTREALLLAKDCQKLRSFVHVSTAYSHATSKTRGGEVLEQFHQSPLPPETLIQMAESVERDRLEDITPTFIKGWPNTYCFTKAVAEEQVRVMAADLPVCIVRPSIVISSYREPCPAWLDMSCSFSASGFIIGSGLGLNHVLHTVKDTDMSLVPVDFVNNALIAAAWNTAINGRNATISGKDAAISEREVAIYNMVTSSKNKLLWDTLKTKLDQIADTIPTPRAVWRSYVVTTSSYQMYLLIILLFHFIPGLVLDGVCLLLGKEARFIKLYKKIHKLSISLSYFMTNLHKMDDKNLTNLKEKMSDTDKKIFNFDMAPLNWSEMVKIWCLGVRKYIIKDGLKDTDKAIRKQFWFRILNYIFFGIYVYVLWIIFACIILPAIKLFYR